MIPIILTIISEFINGYAKYKIVKIIKEEKFIVISYITEYKNNEELIEFEKEKNKISLNFFDNTNQIINFIIKLIDKNCDKVYLNMRKNNKIFKYIFTKRNYNRKILIFKKNFSVILKENEQIRQRKDKNILLNFSEITNAKNLINKEIILSKKEKLFNKDDSLTLYNKDMLRMALLKEKEKNTKIKNTNTKIKKAFSILKEVLKVKKNKLNKSRNKNKELVKQNTDLTQKFTDINLKNEKLITENSELNSRIEKSDESLLELSSFKDKFLDATKELSDIKSENVLISSEIREKEEKLKDFSQNNVTLTQELSDLKTNLREKNEIIHKLKDYNLLAKKIIDNSDSLNRLSIENAKMTVNITSPFTEEKNEII